MTMNLELDFGLCATIIADPLKKNLTAQVIENFSNSCEDLQKIEVIQENIAANVYFKGRCGNKPQGFDVIIRNAANHPKLLLCDMESTIIKNEFLDEIANHLGIGEQVANITARAMNGELGFEESMHERINLVKGLKKSDILKLADERMVYNEGAKELIAGCKARGIKTILVSGGFTIFTEIVKNHLGFDEHYANELIFDGENLSGVKEPILGKEAKLEILKEQCKELGIEASQTITIGDGANDLPMLHAAGAGIAYRAKPIVKKEIENQFNYANLDGLLYLAA